MTSYVANIWNAIQGKPSEYFADLATNPVAAVATAATGAVTGTGTGTGTTTTSSGSPMMGGFAAIVLLLISVIPFFIFAYGAAKLSWCLNQSYGYSILCFFFPGVYYPFYSFFLNPLCITPTVGGRRRNY